MSDCGDLSYSVTKHFTFFSEFTGFSKFFARYLASQIYIASNSKFKINSNQRRIPNPGNHQRWDLFATC